MWMILAQCSCGHSCKSGKQKQQKCRHHGSRDHVSLPDLASCAWHHCSTTASRLPWQLASLLPHLPRQGQLPLQKAAHCCPWLGCCRIFFSKLTSLGKSCISRNKVVSAAYPRSLDSRFSLLDHLEKQNH